MNEGMGSFIILERMIDMKGQTYVIIAIVLLILVAVFAVTNVDAVEVNYLFWVVESPLILVILFSVLMGGLLVATAGSVRFFQLKKEIKELQKELHVAQALTNEDAVQSKKHKTERTSKQDSNPIE